MEPVKDLTHLKELAHTKRAVISSLHGAKVLPAAFVLNMTGLALEKMFRSGLFVYEKQDDVTKAPPHFRRVMV